MIADLVKVWDNKENAPALLEATESVTSYNAGHNMILTEDVLQRYRANQGYVYLIHAIGTDRYKIGRSVSPPVRLETLKKQSPYPLQMTDVIGIWKKYLDQHLDDDQFSTAVDKAILSTPFMPVPEKLIEFASGSLQTKAMEEWRVCVLRWAASSVENQEKIWPSLSPRCRAAVQIIGGFYPVGIAEYGELRQLEQQFIAAYCQCAPNAKALPPGKIPPISFEGEEKVTERSASVSEPIAEVLEIIEERIGGKKATDEQAAANMFRFKYGWTIDTGRLAHYLELDLVGKQRFISRFGFLMRNRPDWKSAVSQFDKATGYQAPPPEIDSRAIAKQWLQN